MEQEALRRWLYNAWRLGAQEEQGQRRKAVELVNQVAGRLDVPRTGNLCYRADRAIGTLSLVSQILNGYPFACDGGRFSPQEPASGS